MVQGAGCRDAEEDDTRSTYPRYPGALLLTKGNLPCGFQRLEEFIWLEEGAKGKGIENAKGDQEEEDVGGGRG